MSLPSKRGLEFAAQSGAKPSIVELDPEAVSAEVAGVEVASAEVVSTDRRGATAIAMLMATLAVTVGDLFMSQAMRALGPLKLEALELWWHGQLGFSQVAVALPGQLYTLLGLIFGQAKVWVAIGCMLTFLVLWMISLSWADLTFVMPLTALTYVLNAMLVGPVLGEHVSGTRWIGTFLIAAGVALVTFEKPDVAESSA